MQLLHLVGIISLLTVCVFVTNIPGFIDEDDLFVDAAIDMKVFDFLHHTVLENESIYKEVVYLLLFLFK